MFHLPPSTFHLPPSTFNLEPSTFNPFSGIRARTTFSDRITGIGHVGIVAARLRFDCIEVTGSRLRACALDGRIDLAEWRLVTDTPGASEAEGDFTIFRS